MIGGTRQRIHRGASATLTYQGVDADGEPGEVDPGTVTCVVTGSDGTTLSVGAVSGSGIAARTVALTSVQTAELDILTASWQVGGVEIARTRHDIVGGVYFTLAALRESQQQVSDQSVYPGPKLVEARTAVEVLIESACGGSSFVPRFDVWRSPEIKGGFREIDLPTLWFRRARWVRIWEDNESYTDLTPTEVAAVPGSDIGSICLPYSVCDVKLEVGYEHGLDAPPADLRRAAMHAVRNDVTRVVGSALLERATQMQLNDGGQVTLATPGTGRWHTGIPVIDEVLARYDFTIPGVG